MHRLRGVLGTALTWALVWLPVGVVMGLIALNARREVMCLYCPPFWDWFPLFVLSWTLWGAVSGGVFAIVLMIAERRRSLAELSFTRTALWGAVGSLSLPAALMVRDAIQSGVLIERLGVLPVVLTAGLGAACAAGTLRIARQSLTH
jgi:hypothetical protein